VSVAARAELDERLDGLPQHPGPHLPQALISCIISAAQGDNKVDRKMSLQRVRKMDNISGERRIFPAGAMKVRGNIRKIARHRIAGSVITGVSAPVFNTRHFRRSFSS